TIFKMSRILFVKTDLQKKNISYSDCGFYPDNPVRINIQIYPDRNCNIEVLHCIQFNKIYHVYFKFYPSLSMLTMRKNLFTVSEIWKSGSQTQNFHIL